MSNHSLYKKGKAPPKPGARKGGRPKKGTVVVKPPKKPAGRPNKLEIDPKLAAKLRQAILMGAPVLTAAALHDISYDTMRNWVLEGKKDPSSQYGALLKILNKAVAEWEIRDLSVLEAHAVGKPAEYLQQPMRDNEGKPIFDEKGKPMMEYVRDGEGRPILKSSEIKSDWRAAMERMARRKPRSWAPKLGIDLDSILTFDNKDQEANPQEALTFEQAVAQAVEELEDEV